MSDWKAEAHRLKFTRHRSYTYIAKRLGRPTAQIRRVLGEKRQQRLDVTYKQNYARRQFARTIGIEPEEMEQRLQLLRRLRFQ
jgi:IS30 family transposase